MYNTSQREKGGCDSVLPFVGGDLGCASQYGHKGEHSARTEGGGRARVVSWSSQTADDLGAKIEEATAYFHGEALALARLEVLGGGFVSKVRAAVEGKGSPGVGSRSERRKAVKPGRERKLLQRRGPL